jgi:hypothetical protein
MTTFIHKVDSTSYDLLAQGLNDKFSMHVLSTLFVKDFDLMIEHMEQMRVTTRLPFYYRFPIFKTAPEMEVKLVKNVIKEYQIILNFGAIILSEMSSDEFDVALYECKEIRNLIPGSKVYFPPVKDIFKNDK